MGITTAAVKKLPIINYDFLCSYYCLTYPVYKAHAPSYVVIRELSDSTASFYLISQAKIFVNIFKKSFFFSTISSELFLILRRAERYIIKHVHKSARYTCHVLIKF